MFLGLVTDVPTAMGPWVPLQDHSYTHWDFAGGPHPSPLQNARQPLCHKGPTPLTSWAWCLVNSQFKHRPRTSHRTVQAVLQGKGAAPHSRNKSQSKVWATPTKKKFAELTEQLRMGGGLPKRQRGLEAMGQATPGAHWHWPAHPCAWWGQPAPSVRCKGCLSTWWASQGWKGEK